MSKYVRFLDSGPLQKHSTFCPRGDPTNANEDRFKIVKDSCSVGKQLKRRVCLPRTASGTDMESDTLAETASLITSKCKIPRWRTNENAWNFGGERGRKDPQQVPHEARTPTTKGEEDERMFIRLR